VRKSLICCVLFALASFAAGAQTFSEPSAQGWVESPYRNFGAPQVLLPGRAVLLDEADDANLKGLLSVELRRLFNDLYVREGWHYPFADGEPVRVFVARKEAGGLRRVASRSVEGGRLVGISAAANPPRAVLVTRSSHDFGSRPLFDATAPVLPGLARTPGFVF